MASRKEYEMLFQLNAQMGSSYSKTFKAAQDELAAMQKEIQSLSKTQSDITAYQKQQTAVENTRKRLELLLLTTAPVANEHHHMHLCNF